VPAARPHQPHRSAADREQHAGGGSRGERRLRASARAVHRSGPTTQSHARDVCAQAIDPAGRGVSPTVAARLLHSFSPARFSPPAQAPFSSLLRRPHPPKKATMALSAKEQDIQMLLAAQCHLGTKVRVEGEVEGCGVFFCTRRAAAIGGRQFAHPPHPTTTLTTTHHPPSLHQKKNPNATEPPPLHGAVRLQAPRGRHPRHQRGGHVAEDAAGGPRHRGGREPASAFF
jgi:hypothetical protein